MARCQEYEHVAADYLIGNTIYMAMHAYVELSCLNQLVLEVAFITFFTLKTVCYGFDDVLYLQ